MFIYGFFENDQLAINFNQNMKYSYLALILLIRLLET
jgi:hypothetical protein